MAAVAAPCAVLIAWGLLQFSLTLESGVFSRTAAPAITGHVTTVAFVVTVLVGLASCVPGAVAVAPWRGSLHDRTRAAARGRCERSLMTVQVSLVFAVGARALLVALVLQGLVRTNVGFTKTDFLVVKMEPRGAATIDANVQLARYNALLDDLNGQGIRAAATSSFPFTRSDSRSTFEPRPSCTCFLKTTWHCGRPRHRCRCEACTSLPRPRAAFRPPSRQSARRLPTRWRSSRFARRLLSWT